MEHELARKEARAARPRTAGPSKGLAFILSTAWGQQGSQERMRFQMWTAGG